MDVFSLRIQQYGIDFVKFSGKSIPSESMNLSMTMFFDFSNITELFHRKFDV